MGRTGQRPAVVFVNYRSEALISPRARALVVEGLEVVVVDNSGSYAGEGFVVDPGSNLGFGAAVNLGVSSSRARRVILQNPDVNVAVPDVVRLANLLDEQATPGLLAPSLDTGRTFRSRGFAYPSTAREVAVASRAVVLRGRTGARQGVPRAGRRGRALDTSPEGRFGSGALLAVDRTAFEGVGGFDEELFLYGEDLDLWHRVRRAGFTVGFEPSVVAVHSAATGSPMGASTRELLRWVGVERFFEVHGHGSWTTVRRVHRVLARRVPPDEAGIVASVQSSWDAGLTPRVVSARVVDLVRRGSRRDDPRR